MHKKKETKLAGGRDKLKTVRWLNGSKPDNLNSTGGTHVVEKESQLPQTVLRNTFTPPRKKILQKKKKGKLIEKVKMLVSE